MDFYKRYQFNPKTDLLGKGGFSKVYMANDTLLDRTVALKFFTGHGFEKYQVLNEIKKVIRFEHANLCKYYDVAVIDTTNIIGEPETIEVGIMEYLDAGELKTYLRNNPQDIDRLLIDVLKGLSYLHKRGIVHRDLKPQNIIVKMVDDEPVAKITDFGISKLLSDDDTSASALIGTIEYMAPEQFNPKKYGINGKITTNLDLWSFGLLVYEVVVNQPLFGSRSKGHSAEQIMRNILTDTYLTRIKLLPVKYQAIIDRCLVKQASQRAQTALELIPLFSEGAVDLNEIFTGFVLGADTEKIDNAEIDDQATGDQDSEEDDDSEVDDDFANMEDSTEHIVSKDPPVTDLSLDTLPEKGGHEYSQRIQHNSLPGENAADVTQILHTSSGELPVKKGTNTPFILNEPNVNLKKGVNRQKLFLYAIIPVVLITGFFIFRGIGSDHGSIDAKNLKFSGNTVVVQKSLPVPMPNLQAISGGRFIMGTNGSEDTTVLPAHAVRLSNFLINKYEVTIGEFRKFIHESNYKTTAEENQASSIYVDNAWKQGRNINWRFDLSGKLIDTALNNVPVVHVSWWDANKYCEWLSLKNSRHYRLPTEAEWEFAAKGGIKTAGSFYSGSKVLEDVAWYSKNSNNKIHEVGGKQPNELGLYDMSGNVMEWCKDWYGDDYFKDSPVTDPSGPDSGTERVARGGSWYTSNDEKLRNAYRDRFLATASGGQLGFRICEVR
ncbi:MAG: bifunctional serine/threonine-protein kinase/formylglycine-generating enzyme family protein [Chitinophagaceae bacterium]